MTAPEWWRALPPADAAIPCGQGQHTVRWTDGALVFPAHPDPEGERVLAALGGGRATCIDVAGLWDRHRDDLAVLALAPRSAADRISVAWEDIDRLRHQPGPGRRGWVARPWVQGTVRAVPAPAPTPTPSPAPVTGPTPPPGRPLIVTSGSWLGPATTHPHRHRSGADWDPAAVRQLELGALFSLGPAFQVRLAAAVAAAWAGPGHDADRVAHRPTLTAALAGRLAPAAGAWLGIDPDQVTVSLHDRSRPDGSQHGPQHDEPPPGEPQPGEPQRSAARHDGPGWGAIAATGSGSNLRVRIRLPLDWLARVWACGLAVAGDHLVVAVTSAHWPEVRVLAVPAPGAAPVPLTLRGEPRPAGDAAFWPEWRIS